MNEFWNTYIRVNRENNLTFSLVNKNLDYNETPLIRDQKQPTNHNICGQKIQPFVSTAI